MKGIMRKRLLALLSAAGLAGATSAAGQVLKPGSNQGQKSQNESTIKLNKVRQEKAAVKSKDVDKSSKVASEQKAAQDVVTEKVGADHIVHKHIAGVKYEDAKKTNKTSKASLDAGSKDASKMTKASKTTVHQDALTVKQKIAAQAAGVEVEDKRKLTKTEQEGAAAAAQVKGKKSAAESGASTKYEWIKAGKKQTGANATQVEGTQKTPQTTPK